MEKYHNLINKRKRFIKDAKEYLNENKKDIIKEIEFELRVKLNEDCKKQKYVVYSFQDKETCENIYLVFNLPNFTLVDFDDQTPSQKYRDKIEYLFQL
ncbi:MAG: hypothetical protein ACOCP4_04250 [Candidatus Woesearchaeota archaeon]